MNTAGPSRDKPARGVAVVYASNSGHRCDGVISLRAVSVREWMASRLRPHVWLVCSLSLCRSS